MTSISRRGRKGEGEGKGRWEENLNLINHLLTKNRKKGREGGGGGLLAILPFNII